MTNSEQIRNFEIDILKDNYITLVLDNNTVNIDNEIFENVNFIKMQILTSRPIPNLESLYEFVSRTPNFEVNVKYINVGKLDVGIITRFNNIKLSNTDDEFIDTIKKDVPVKTELGSAPVYDENGIIMFTMRLFRNYLESNDLTEYILNIKYNNYDISLVYGDVNDKKIKIDFNQFSDISIVVMSANGKPYELSWDVFDPYCDTQTNSDLNVLFKLINANSINLAFGHLL